VQKTEQCSSKAFDGRGCQGDEKNHGQCIGPMVYGQGKKTIGFLHQISMNGELKKSSMPN